MTTEKGKPVNPFTSPHTLTQAHLAIAAVAHIEAQSWPVQTTSFLIDKPNRTCSFFDTRSSRRAVFLQSVSLSALGKKQENPDVKLRKNGGS